MISELDTKVDVWDVIFICEFDGSLGVRDVSCAEGHFIFRHWPGPGSYSIAFIMHKRFRYALRSVVPPGRALRAYFKSDMSLDLTVIGVHGGHGDGLQGSLADLSYLLRSSNRFSSKVIIGDHNVDILPILANDPWADCQDRCQHHQEQRDLLFAFCNRFGVNTCTPFLAGEPLTGRWASDNSLCVFSRVPVGD